MSKKGKVGDDEGLTCLHRTVRRNLEDKLVGTLIDGLRLDHVRSAWSLDRLRAEEWSRPRDLTEWLCCQPLPKDCPLLPFLCREVVPRLEICLPCGIIQVEERKARLRA
jgi:hypothetical protein